MPELIRYRPRNDFVLFRFIDRGQVRGIITPDKSAQGKERIVMAMGPDVVDLKIGDKVMVIGSPGQDVIAMPEDKDIYLTKQANVVLVVESDV